MDNWLDLEGVAKTAGAALLAEMEQGGVVTII
jgi:hypothetical protein